MKCHAVTHGIHTLKYTPVRNMVLLAMVILQYIERILYDNVYWFINVFFYQYLDNLPKFDMAPYKFYTAPYAVHYNNYNIIAKKF